MVPNRSTHHKGTCEFEDADRNEYDIRKGVINFNTDFTVYKFTVAIILIKT